MKRIKIYLLLVLFVCCVSSARASGEYTSILAQINQKLLDLKSYIDNVSVNVGTMASFLVDDMYYEVADINGNTSATVNTLNDILTRCNEFKTLFESSVSDLEEISHYTQESDSTLNYIMEYNSTIEAASRHIDENVTELLSDLSNIEYYANSLPEIKEKLQTVVQIIGDQGDLNKEDTQLHIVDLLQVTTETISDKLDAIIQQGAVTDVADSITSLKEVVKSILQFLRNWDSGFFRYLYDRTWPQHSLEFYHISGSPFFESGYLTYNQQIGTTSPYSFVDWLAQVLSGHTQGLQVINDNILFIAKVLGTNAQDQAMSEFQEDAQDTVSTISTQYTELINSSGYTPKQFDFSKTKLQNVRQVLSGLDGVNSYDSVKVHNLNFASFEIFGFPTQVDYKYDLSETSSFWEVCRAFFTCVWVLLFASVFLMVVRVFYKFYHICFSALAGNRPEGYEVSNIPLHW